MGAEDSGQIVVSWAGVSLGSLLFVDKDRIYNAETNLNGFTDNGVGTSTIHLFGLSVISLIVANSSMQVGFFICLLR